LTVPLCSFTFCNTVADSAPSSSSTFSSSSSFHSTETHKPQITEQTNRKPKSILAPRVSTSELSNTLRKMWSNWLRHHSTHSKTTAYLGQPPLLQPLPRQFEHCEAPFHTAIYLSLWMGHPCNHVATVALVGRMDSFPRILCLHSAQAPPVKGLTLCGCTNAI
jgi:hypothetical protein